MAWQGSPREAVEAAYRAFVAQSFDILLKDPASGVLRVERTYEDQGATAWIEEQRVVAYAALSSDERYIAQRLHSDIAVPGWVQRRLTINLVVTPTSATITPRAIACIMRENVAQGCTEAPSLSGWDLKVIDFLASALAAPVPERDGQVRPATDRL